MSEDAAIPWVDLRARAHEVSRTAYAPYSNFHVGAAGLVDDGRIVTGCNVENASYGLTLCAECALVCDLHRSGGGRLIAVTVTDADGELLAPCGRCRQLLLEAGGPQCAVNEHTTVAELLPDAFEFPTSCLARASGSKGEHHAPPTPPPPSSSPR